MSRYNVFYLRAKGTEDSCMKCAAIVDQYDGHSDDPYIAAKSGAGNNCVIEMRGALRGDVIKYMIDLPPYEESLAGLSKALDLEVEVFASDPNEPDFFEHYHYRNGECTEKSLPPFVPSEEDFDEMGIDEIDRQKYDKVPYAPVFALKSEYLTNASWDFSSEEMICPFKIEMDEEKSDSKSDTASDKTAMIAEMYGAGLPVDDIAGILGISEDEVKTTLGI